MAPKTPKLPANVLDALEGCSWELRCGSKHWQIRIDGQLVGIWPMGNTKERYRDRNRNAMRNNIQRWRRQHGR